MHIVSGGTYCMKTILVLLVFFSAARILPAAEEYKLPYPFRTPLGSSNEQAQYIEKGTLFHDEGRYDEAINLYRRVLDKNPDNAHAWYELALSLQAKGDRKAALESSLKAAEYTSEELPLVYLLAGNILDDMGKQDNAIAVYTTALQRYPNVQLLHFNAGLAQHRRKNYVEAEMHYLNALRLDPTQAAAHYALAQTFIARNDPFRAVLALSRFLVIEPSSQRSKKALRQLLPILRNGVGERLQTVRTSSGEEIIADDSAAFASELLMLQFTRIKAFFPDSTKNLPGELSVLISQYDNMLGVMTELQNTKEEADKAYRHDLFATVYLPFFEHLYKSKQTEVFCRYIMQSTSFSEREWLKRNSTKVESFKNWCNRQSERQ